jgi:hypothetical protein
MPPCPYSTHQHRGQNEQHHDQQGENHRSTGWSLKLPQKLALFLQAAQRPFYSLQTLLQERNPLAEHLEIRSAAPPSLDELEYGLNNRAAEYRHQRYGNAKYRNPIVHALAPIPVV